MGCARIHEVAEKRGLKKGGKESSGDVLRQVRDNGSVGREERRGCDVSLPSGKSQKEQLESG